MKKFKLFLAALAAMVGLSAQAQLTDGTVYWIQDAATGQFITRGGNWGTRAVAEDVGGIGFKAEYINDGVYKLQTVDRTLAGNTAYFGTGMYLDQNTQTEWSITASGEGYTISSGTQYLNISGKSNQQNQVSLVAAGEAAVWKFLTRAEYKAALAAKKNAEAVTLATTLGLDGITTLAELEAEIAGEDYVTVDQTSKITNPTIADNLEGWTLSKAGSPRGYQENNGDKQPGVGNGCAEFWNGSGSASQRIENLPAGLYKITMLGLYRVHNYDNANNVGLDNSSSPAYVYANGNKTEFANWLDYSSKPNNRAGALSAFNNGDYKNTLYTYVGTDGVLDFGVMCASWNDNNWQVFGQFSLTQIYSIAMYKKAYDDAMTAATDAQTSLTGFSVYATQKSTLDAAITANTLTGDDLTDVDKLTDAATNLNNAAAAVAKEKAACDQYASIASAIEGNTNVNLTSYVNNASFETGDLSGWTSVDGGDQANNHNFNDTHFVERWKNGAALGSGSLTHDAIVLPAGVYRITADAQNIEQYNSNVGGSGLFLCANDEQTEIGAKSNYDVYVKVADKETLIIKFLQENCTGNWIAYDNITLTYVGEDFPAYTLVDGKMSATAATAQSNAETTFNNDKTVANYNALLTAITAAQASKEAYEKAATAIADAKTLGTNFNFATTAATTTFTEAVATVETAYNNGTLTDANANNGANLGTVVVGWHAARSSENFTIAEAYMQSAWTGGELNDWSIEGDSDGSNFHVPFFQNWIADANSLAEGTTSGQLTGLDNGLYQVSAWVRVRIKNGQEAGTVPSGITLAVNDGEAVNACAGTQVGETQFYLATITAEGLVKDGTLNAVFTRSADNNISWLAFKNVKYTKVRDLTPEEAFVAATDEDYAALNAAIEAHTLGFEAGEYAPYNNVEAAATLVAAKAIDQTAQNSQEDVQAATAAITNATWTANTAEVNAVYDGSFEADYSGQTGNINPIGWQRVKGAAADGYNVRLMNGNNAGLAATTSGKAIFTKQSGYYGYADGYTMPLKANTMYKVTFVYGGWGDCKKDGYVSMAAPDGSAVTLSATDLPVDATNADADVNAWKSYEAFFTTGEAGDYVLGLRKKNYDTSGQSQYVYGDIVIVKATADDIKDQLLAELNTAKGIDTEANVGDATFQIPATAVTALTSVISDAQDVYDNAATATVADVLQAIEDLKAAEEAYANAELNAPNANKRYAVTMHDADKAWDGNAITFIAGGREGEGNYNVQYAAVANVNLCQALKFTAVEGKTNTYYISVINTSGTEQYLTSKTLAYGDGTVNDQIRTTDNLVKAVEISVKATDGGFKLYNQTGTEISRNKTNPDNGLYPNGDVGSYFSITEAEKPSITINTTAAGWGTTMLPFAVAEIPEGVKVYTCTGAEGATLTLNEVTALEANKPYIIEGTWNDTLTGDAQGTALNYTEGLLTGVYTATSAPVGSYVLQKNNDKVGFYLVADGKQPTVGANRAYVTRRDESEGVKAFYLGENDLPTAIQSVFDGLVDGDAYDLAGRKVQKLQKGGVYIINGKKVVVK